jgi:lysyl endopeptidase
VVYPFSHYRFGSDVVKSTTLKLDNMNIEENIRLADMLPNNTKAFQHAQINDHDIDFMTQSTMTEMDGGKLYSMTFHMENALSFAFHFDAFWIPEGAAMHFVSEHDQFGSLDHRNRWSQGNQMTRHIDGNTVEIQYFTTTDVQPKLHINKVTTGYRKIMAGACNIQNVCKQSTAPCAPCSRRQTSCSVQCTYRWIDDDTADYQNKWADQEWEGVGKAVVGVQSNFGSLFCSGTFINNADRLPLVMTARHCGVGSSDLFRALYSDPTCSSISDVNGPRDFVVGDLTVLDQDTAIDHSLVRVSEGVPRDWGIYLVGYSAAEAGMDETVGVHHPSGGNKKISHCGSSLTKDSWSGGGTQDHWRCAAWDVATTEPGSSGSGIFKYDTKQLVGQLHGGTAACPAFNGWDSYGGIFASQARTGVNRYLSASEMMGRPLYD